MIKCLVPFNLYRPSPEVDVVDIDATSEPDSGSVRPQAPTDVPSISGGKNLDFCSSLPNLAMLCNTNPI